MTTVYGLANCDTVKRARAWLADAGYSAIPTTQRG